MAYIPELLSNRCGGMSFVHKGKACKLKYDGRRVKYWRCFKVCADLMCSLLLSVSLFCCMTSKGAISNNLDVTSVLKQRPHMETCQVDQQLAYKMEKKRY
ncbi:hypothetical protein T02_4869 [Trichinella nativa]|uniref:FLYWCH-type domain-containing protein n=1 Tax=Trichinella nativa TaxID=6335 RepID=A0A0V1LDW0_9BILA|nr:hypothetical protein T02_4869 [Trichinella nativa]